MPTAALYPCPTCRQVGCTTHTKQAWRGRQSLPPPRMRGRKLQAARLALWDKEPHCRGCGRLLLPSQMIRDHIIPLAEGGQDIETNTQPLCSDCNETKTQAESARGVRRHGGV